MSTGDLHVRIHEVFVICNFWIESFPSFDQWLVLSPSPRRVIVGLIYLGVSEFFLTIIFNFWKSLKVALEFATNAKTCMWWILLLDIGWCRKLKKVFSVLKLFILFKLTMVSFSCQAMLVCLIIVSLLVNCVARVNNIKFPDDVPLSWFIVGEFDLKWTLSSWIAKMSTGDLHVRIHEVFVICNFWIESFPSFDQWLVLSPSPRRVIVGLIYLGVSEFFLTIIFNFWKSLKVALEFATNAKTCIWWILFLGIGSCRKLKKVLGVLKLFILWHCFC